MLYTCGAWGLKKKMDIHLKANPMTTHNNMVYGKLGRFPLYAAVKKRFIGIWGRLLESKDTQSQRFR